MNIPRLHAAAYKRVRLEALMKTRGQLLLFTLCAWVLWEHGKMLVPESKVEPQGAWLIVGVADRLEDCSKLLDKAVADSVWLRDFKVVNAQSGSGVRDFTLRSKTGANLMSLRFLCVPGTLDPRPRPTPPASP